jgi:menaquinone-dependent protoporphyrinogen oxidase
MQTIIIYASKHGCTETCAQKLKDQLPGHTDMVNVKTASIQNLDAYDTIIIGGSIHAGQIQRNIKKFCQNNLNLLMQKKVGLFICCMEEGDKAREEFNMAYPEALRRYAAATGVLGGRFDFKKMNAIERYLVKKIANVNQSVSKISEEAISRFASEIW